jgi:hypothetical protein
MKVSLASFIIKGIAALKVTEITELDYLQYVASTGRSIKSTQEMVARKA